MLIAIISFAAGAAMSWLVTRHYARQSSHELRAMNDALGSDNKELKQLVEKLPSDVREIVASDARVALSVSELSELLNNLHQRHDKRPIIHLEYSWTENEPKDKPFTVNNSGDEEARNLRIAPITLREREFIFATIGQLAPRATVTREPQASANAGLLFRTLINGIEHAITSRAQEIKTVAPVDSETMARFGDMLEAERQAIAEFSHIPVVATYEDRHHTTTTLHYQLNVTGFGQVSMVTLDLVREQSAHPLHSNQSY